MAFCDERGAEALPASEELVAAYLSKRAEEVTLSTIQQDVVAIRWMHERHGLESPTEGAGAFRRAELARIREEHITLNADGMEVRAPKSKTEPRTVGINL